MVDEGQLFATRSSSSLSLWSDLEDRSDGSYVWETSCCSSLIVKCWVTVTTCMMTAMWTTTIKMNTRKRNIQNRPPEIYWSYQGNSIEDDDVCIVRTESFSHVTVWNYNDKLKS
ncbi:hypothetical protein KIN20_020448 [Parelaphostrongylus tenuis]|uniref:Uncharacterized protein n=1 Tax=Parelaphostrongylus tenuis TaxID=148309 RepID=A0AAD5N9U7_PARTN|nr:hypothetical protein KIN20_020448 [Parelaphostrongylus tenuis]